MSEKLPKINGMPKFNGPFGELIVDYLDYKRAQGYKMGDPIVYRLREMDLFFQSIGITDIKITREMYDKWTAHRPPEKETNIQKRQAAIRGFAGYLVSRGYTEVYTGHDDTRMFKRDFIPYVFSKGEITEMFRILRGYCQTSPGYENDTLLIAMQMYYCCGFRKAEVQNLRLQDIDVQTGKITVLHGKNDVSRIVVASVSLLTQIQDYHKKYLSTEMPGDYFLLGAKSRQHYENFLYRRFHQLLMDAKIQPRTDGGRQRLHDIRHTFCVRALEQMQEKGFDLYTSLPLLSRYLGHKHITETEYYLRMVEDHFDGILKKASDYHHDVYPSCKGGDADE